MSTRRLRQSSYTILILSTIYIFSLFVSSCMGVRFYLHDHERRCFRFESEYDTLVQAHAKIANGKGSAELTIEVRDGGKHVIYQSHQLADHQKSSFSFRTPKYDPSRVDRDLEAEEEEAYDYDPREMEGWFEACLLLALDRSTHDSHAQRAVTFWVKAEEYHLENREEENRKASDDQVHSVSNSLQDIQSTLQKMVSEIVVLQQRERRLVDHSNTTARRLVKLAVFSFIILLVTSVLQFMHFKRYFKSKKLI